MSCNIVLEAAVALTDYDPALSGYMCQVDLADFENGAGPHPIVIV